MGVGGRVLGMVRGLDAGFAEKGSVIMMSVHACLAFNTYLCMGSSKRLRKI
jgi:hypothetical protein